MAATSNDRVSRSALGSGGTILLVSNTAYFVYLGVIQPSVTIKFVEFNVITLGVGAQTAEVGLFTSPLPPNKGSLVLTKLLATGTVDALTATGVKRNTAAFNQLITPGSLFLWVGIRTAMATTQPTLRAVNDDMAQGYALTTAAAGALTGTGPWTGAIVAGTVFQPAPDLRLTQD